MTTKHHLNQSRQLLEATIKGILQEVEDKDAVLKTIRLAFNDPNDDSIAAAAEALLSSGLPRAYCDDVLSRMTKSAKTPEAGEVVSNQIAAILDDPENWHRFNKQTKTQQPPMV